MTALIAQAIVISALLLAYFQADSITYNQLLIVALGLGFAGASFAVALPQAGQWYPPKLQGVVLGIAGAGNIGVVIDFLFAPKMLNYGDGIQYLELVQLWQSLYLLHIYS